MENGNGKYGVIIIFELLIIIGLYLGIKIVNPEIVVKDQIVADAREIFNPEEDTEEEEMEVAEAGISDKLVFFGDTSEMYAEDVNSEAAGDVAASDGSTPEGYANGVGADYDEAELRKVMEAHDIVISIDMGEGDAKADIWSCDFSYEYVKINGEYHT